MTATRWFNRHVAHEFVIGRTVEATMLDICVNRHSSWAAPRFVEPTFPTAKERDGGEGLPNKTSRLGFANEWGRNLDPLRSAGERHIK